METFMKDSNWKRQLIIIVKASGLSETYSEPSETSMTEVSSKIVDCIQPITIFKKPFILRVSQGHEYVSNNAKQNPGALSLIPQ